MQNSAPVLKWHERFQLEIAIHYTLFPTRDQSWKTWFFDPNGGITVPGQEITNRYQLPESYFYGIDTQSITTNKNKRFTSLVFWIHGALRICGLDVGIGFFYRKQDKLATTAIVGEKTNVG